MPSIRATTFSAAPRLCERCMSVADGPALLRPAMSVPNAIGSTLWTVAPQPRKTRSYIAKLLPLIGLAAVDGITAEVAPPLDWREAPLFGGRSRRNPTAHSAQRNPGSFATSATLSAFDALSNEAHSDGVFCVQARDEQTQ